MEKHSRYVVGIFNNDMRYPELPKKHSNVDKDIIMHKLPKDGAVRVPWINAILKGNLIEWSIPDDVDIKGVEFKALVSGSHTITQDFVYFRHQQYYGLSCFALKSVSSESERGARMKSVGIICTKYTSLHEHQEFLEKEVRKQLDVPYHYDDLMTYFNLYRNCPQRNNYFRVPDQQAYRLYNNDDLPVMKISHPTGCFSQFIKYFGESIFILWKFLLLRKRILFVAPPPVGIQCYRVYCTGLLGSNGMRLRSFQRSDLLFNVGLCDNGAIGSLDAFVACSTESILKSKPELYDLYVDKQKVICHNEFYKPMLMLNSADRARFVRLCKYNDQDNLLLQTIKSSNFKQSNIICFRFSNEQLTSGGDVINDEKMYTRFFIEQNNRILKILMEIASRDNRVLTRSHIREMGLEPKQDRRFIICLTEVYNLTVTLEDETCCG